MKERPILYSAPMVRAKLAGIKTQTRRMVKPQPSGPWAKLPVWVDADGFFHSGSGSILGTHSDLKCPYGKVGDRLYGKEMHRYHGFTEDGEPHIEYCADLSTRLCKVPLESQDRVQEIWQELSEPANFGVYNRACDIRWRPSIHMPRWASRILDEIVEIRVERVQDITEADAIAEGCSRIRKDGPFFAGDQWGATAIECYKYLWNSINGEGSWESNPWVWVIVTKPVKVYRAKKGGE